MNNERNTELHLTHGSDWLSSSRTPTFSSDGEYIAWLEKRLLEARKALAPFSREASTWRSQNNSAIGICEWGFDPTEAEFTQQDLQNAWIVYNEG